MTATPTNPPHPMLRLVNGDVAPTQLPLRSGRTILRPALSATAAPEVNAAQLDAAQTAIAEANKASVTLSALDPRWVLAVSTFRELDGGVAAVLSPEKRARLLKSGQRMGLRPFDSNLVMAIVQDGARRGVDPLNSEAIARLHMVHPAPERTGAPHARSVQPSWAIVFSAAALAALATALLLLQWR